MYQYTETDQKIIDERVTQYRDQTERFLAGKLSEEEFLPLRLQNGLYVQRYAPMLRVCVPYGLMSSQQMRKLAELSRTYDKGYVHVSTRQNIQFNWPELEQVPNMLEELAKVQMHAIQTSGNCIRNVTTDQYAGVIADETADPRPWCEIIRQWATFHPEFAYSPRKFKIAVCASQTDRAAVQVHDIGLRIIKTNSGDIAFSVFVGGGLGRTPIIGQLIEESLPKEHLLSYLEAILRVYNRNGRRDNKYKARIKILVKAMGVDAFRSAVEKEWAALKGGELTLPAAEINRVNEQFLSPEYKTDFKRRALEEQLNSNAAFKTWYNTNTVEHKASAYRIVNLSLKPTGVAPGDVSAEQLDAVATLADEFSFGELRTTHNQNIVLADVEQEQLFVLWEKLKDLQLATANIAYLTDMICCPGGDFCALANAKSLPIAEQIQNKFDDLDYLYDLGPLDLNISGCMNACGHHHVGHIGILGVDKKGEEYYQVSLGGNSGTDASLGKIIGPSFFADEIPNVIGKIIDVFCEKRIEGETFLATYRRTGIAPFKERVYAK